jgi:Tfp pilus assembly protein PilF
VSKGSQFRLILLLPLVVYASFTPAQENQEKLLAQEFQSAVAQYHAGNFAQAANQLEKLAPRAPESFEIHELLGLVYAAQSKHEQSVEQLQIGVRLKPDSAAARTNLATSLLHTGKSGLAEEQFRQALALEPDDFQANHNLAEFYLQSGKIEQALPLLEKAQQIRPSSYENGYNLALAYFLTGRLSE